MNVTGMLSCEQKGGSALLPSTDTQPEYLTSGVLCPRRRTPLNPSRAIDPAHLHSVGILYSLSRLPANSPFCISSLSPSIRLKTSKQHSAAGRRTKGAASAQRNPLKCKTTEEPVDRPGSQTERQKSHEACPTGKEMLSVSYKNPV